LSKFKLTLDELREGDDRREVNGLPIFFREDVASHIHRLKIIYENRRLGLLDNKDLNEND
jgi:hypothetical protein